MDRRTRALPAALLLLALLASCAAAPRAPQVGGEQRIYDNDGVYSIPRDRYSTLWLDVSDLEGVSFARATGQTRTDGEKPGFPMTLYDDAGELGDAAEPSFGTVSVKGAQPFRAGFRSFKLTLEGESRFLGNRIFHLNKCPEDLTKLSMKLTLDVFAALDNIVSVNSAFVRLFVRTGGEFEDYGLYTLTENPGGRYLRTHGLDRRGELYEATDFDFSYATWLAQTPAQRADSIEYKNGEEPEKLEALLRALDEDFEAAFETHFDRENYLTWLAGSALLGNRKADTDRFYLYSPSDSEKWYFFPCPTDDLLWEETDRLYRIPNEQMGAGMLLGSALHRRFLGDAENRADFGRKVSELRDVLSDGLLTGLIGEYKTVLAEFAAREPDFTLLSAPPQEIEARIDRIPALIARNYDLILQNLDLPLPPAPLPPEAVSGGWLLRWETPETSGPEVTYRVKVSRDIDGTTVVFEGETTETELLLPQTLSGAFYLHLTARYGDGGEQPLDSWVSRGGGVRAWGVAQLQLRWEGGS